VGEGADFYAGYVTFKGWEADEGIKRPEDYAALLALGGHARPRLLLDIGTGRAELLDWAKAQGIETFGTEIIPALAERAAARGHRMIDPGLSESVGPFDVITAIDVLEHLTPAQTLDLLASVRRLLAADGRFLARFPNGQSPFSGLYQNGDLTHIQYLTPGSLRQMAEKSGLQLAGVYNPRSMPTGLQGIKRRAVYLVRDLIEVALGYAYFGRRVPMDANVAVVLQPSAGDGGQDAED